MKKIFSIVLALALVLMLSPGLLAGTVAAIGPSTWYVVVGGAGNTTGTDWENAFASIQQAIDEAYAGDMIVVGNGTYDEFIDIWKPLTVISRDGAEQTIIFPAPHPTNNDNVADQVVLISANDVVFGGPPGSNDHGFTVKIDGYVDGQTYAPDTGISAWDVANVSILHNIIEIDNIEWADGIYVVEMWGSSLIAGNTVTLGGNSIAWGQGMYVAVGDTIIISENHVQVATEGDDAHGISVYGFHEAKVIDNPVEAIAAGHDVYTSGIYLEGVHRAQVTGNTVVGEADGEAWAATDGIWLNEFGRAEVGDNAVTINSSTSGAIPGSYTGAWGIYVESGEGASVVDNVVTAAVNAESGYGELEGILVYEVHQQVEIARNTVDASVDIQTGAQPGLLTESPASLAARAAGTKGDTLRRTAMLRARLLEHTLGMTANTLQGGQGWGLGIITMHTGYTAIHDNTVDVAVIADAETDEWESAYGGSMVGSFGIYAHDSRPARVIDNHVTSTADAIAQAAAEGSDAYVEAYAFAWGILLEDSHSHPEYGFVPVIDRNSVVAVGNAEATGAAGSGLIIDSESLLGRIQAQLLETADTAASAGPQASWAEADGFALGLGFGIAAWNCPEIQITNNDPVIGAGTVTANITAIDEVTAEHAWGWGQGQSQGLGIYLESSPQAYIAGNGAEGGVSGTGTTRLTIAARENLIESTEGYGSSWASGLGIYASWNWGHMAVIDNNVAAHAEAVTEVASLEEIPGEDAGAQGDSLAYALGIHVQTDSYLISGNAVDAWAHAEVDLDAQSVSSEDPWAMGFAEAHSTGISSQHGHQAQIIGNDPVTAHATAIADVGALEHQMLQDAGAWAGTYASGRGITARWSGERVISHNNAHGSADAITRVLADSSVPLDWAGAGGLATSEGFGLWLEDTYRAEVTWNSFAGDATVSVEATAGATFEDEWTLGYSLAADIANQWSRDSHINYNDMGGGVAAMIEYEHVEMWKYGLYNYGYHGVNARYNWWGDPSGPGGRGAGTGAAIDWSGGYDVPYQWWLSHPIADLLEDKVGYFGFGVEVGQGWNTLSTPVALEHPGFASIAALGEGLDWAIAYYYDPTQANPWQQVNAGFSLYPLEGIYLKMNADDVVFFTTSPATHAPLRNLTKGQSWYLIGPTPYDESFPFTTEMVVDLALVSLEETPGGHRGYNQVVSPLVGDQSPWVYVPGMHTAPMMLGSKAYWVFMENPDTLAGFVFTPLPVYMPLWPPQPPAIGYWPEGLSFTILEWQDWPQGHSLYIYNEGDGDLKWSASNDAPWLNLNPTTGTATREEANRVEVKANALGLSPGKYTTYITITAAEAINTPQTIPVVLNVVQPPAITTLAASNITSDSATLNGSLDSMGEFSSVEVRFEWWSWWGWQWGQTPWQTMTSAGPFSANITGLEADMGYEFSAIVRFKTPDGGYHYIYGDWLYFYTLPDA